ncbi:hypothetical protein DCO45_07415 [Comamonas sp. JNW]|nr:hypothetical protein DCO45_07415 [Comamonas sp. JNW]
MEPVHVAPTGRFAVSQRKQEDAATGDYLEQLKAEGASLLMQNPQEGTPEHAKMMLIDAKIDQLTSPITVPNWKETGL